MRSTIKLSSIKNISQPMKAKNKSIVSGRDIVGWSVSTSLFQTYMIFFYFVPSWTWTDTLDEKCSCAVTTCHYFYVNTYNLI